MTERPPLVIERVPVGSLTAHPSNPRQGDVGAISESLRLHSQYRPLVVQRGGTVLAGNHTLLAAKVLGWTEIDVTYLDVDDDEALRILLTDNRLNDLASYDDSALAALLTDMAQQTPLGLARTGFDGDALDQLLADLTMPSFRPPEVEPGEPPLDPITRADDLWELGEHRLLCGDATQRESYEVLLGAERPELLLTDPPYGVSHGSGVTAAKAIRGDIGQATIPVFFSCALDVLTEDARLYVFGGSEQQAMYHGLWDHHLHQHPRLIVWVKESFVLRQIAYHAQFELVYWGWKGKGGGANYWYGDRTASDVWQVARDSNADREHSTQKPVGVCTPAIRNSCKPGGLVLDPFGGSGTTLIAAESLGRVARLIELDPGYCDVICRRFQSLTGIKPTRDGEPHDFLAEP